MIYTLLSRRLPNPSPGFPRQRSNHMTLDYTNTSSANPVTARPPTPDLYYLTVSREPIFNCFTRSLLSPFVSYLLLATWSFQYGLESEPSNWSSLSGQTGGRTIVTHLFPLKLGSSSASSSSRNIGRHSGNITKSYWLLNLIPETHFLLLHIGGGELPYSHAPPF